MLSTIALLGVLTCGQPPPERQWPLMEELQGTWSGDWLDRQGIRISGWAESTYTAASQTRGDLLTGFNFLPNQYMLQQNWIRIERPIQDEKSNVGYHLDWILPGTDYRFTLARGLFDGQLTANDGGPNLYGIDPVQFYVDWRIPVVMEGLTVRVGRFFCPYGIDSLAAPENFLACDSYSDFYDPFTVTGVLTTLKLNNTWTVVNGLVLGPDTFIDPVARPTYLGRVENHRPGSPLSWSSTLLLTPGGYNVSEQKNMQSLVDFVWTYNLDSRNRLGGEIVFGWEENVPEIGLATWYGIQAYYRHFTSSQYDWAARVEFFNDIQGQLTGFPGLYTAVTTGINYYPCKALIIRPNLRADVNTDSKPFNGKAALFQAIANVIVRW